MSTLRIHTHAKRDVQHAVDFYDEVDPKITDKFLKELFSTFSVIEERPRAFQRKYKDTRVAYLRKFPFGIHYELVEEEILVLAVLHTSRNPRTWFNS